MPNLRSQSITSEGIELVASDGRVFTLTRAQAVAIFQAQQGGSPAARLQRAIDQVKANIEAALGPEQVPAALLELDFDQQGGFRGLGARS